ncbi:MAG: hypothetical protein ACRDKW_09555 [Actinomycetota bacterium]
MRTSREPVRDGFDAEVLLCPGHRWEAEDRTPPGVAAGNPWYVCQVCARCRAIRCDSGDEFGARCLEARHHALAPHRTANLVWPVGGDWGQWAEAARGRWHL